ncbi:MAG: type II 3-dehydroquinate dehydratase [Chloroflexi bacterium]|nr:type II 3-dehydroquinate dehydratase [Chloroflexota bacterium]
MNILILHGPNLNLLGNREPDTYGDLTLDALNRLLVDSVKDSEADLRFYQSNLEGELINALHEAAAWANGAVINPGGYTHTSVALRDAIAAMPYPVIEAHLSNIYAREPFRHTSLTAGACAGLVAGFGWRSYLYALEELIERLKSP